MPLSATIFHVSRCSLHDGPGMRMVIYFKGCNLSCRWCHNPESHRFEKEIAFEPQKCVGCGRCAAVCPQCHILTENGVFFSRSGCVLCGKCTEVCAAKALTVVGREHTVEELRETILKDKAYYGQDGGVTLSGGECLLFPDFAAELLKDCKEHGIGTLVESAFCVPESNVENVFPFTDTFYVDLKLFDSEKHADYTGQPNDRILRNIRTYAKRHPSFIVRIPVIPTVNDDDENLKKSVAFARDCGVKKVELLKFNPLGVSKYQTIGRTATIFAEEAQTKEEMSRLVDNLNAFVGETDYVYSIR